MTMLKIAKVAALVLSLASYTGIASARYIQSDPIGLQGGINTYAYVDGNPLKYVDPLGLLSQCSSGLDALLGLQIGPLYHPYSCWPNGDGSITCRGYGREPGSNIYDAILGSVPGKVLKDNENGTSKSCTPDDKNTCMNKCVADLYKGAENWPPPYSWRASGTQCQDVNRRIVETCTQFCATR